MLPTARPYKAIRTEIRSVIAKGWESTRNEVGDLRGWGSRYVTLCICQKLSDCTSPRINFNGHKFKRNQAGCQRIPEWNVS